MQRTIARGLALAGILSMGLADVAHARAYVFSPVGTRFTLSGSMAVSGQRCRWLFIARTGAQANGRGALTLGTTDGSPRCWGGLDGPPYRMTASGPRTFVIHGVSFDILGGVCGPGDLKVKRVGTALKFDELVGGCLVSGNLYAAPALTIVPAP